MTKQELSGGNMTLVKAKIVETVYSREKFRLISEDAYFFGVFDLPGRGGRVTKIAAKEICKRYGYKLVS